MEYNSPRICKYLFTMSVVGSLANYLPWSSSFPNAIDEINQKAKDFINERRKTPAENQSKSDIVGLMLQVGETDDSLIIDEVRTFLFAGHETTSNMLAWCCYFLSKYPNIQEKVFQEVNEVLGDREPNRDDIGKLKYLKATLEETLRLRPIVPFIPARVASKDVVLEGRTFKKGTALSPYTLAIHWNENNFKDAKQFIPERFLDEKRDDRHHPYVFIPFGAGPRNCIGQKFALQEAIIVLSMTLQKFRVSSEIKDMKRISPLFFPNGLFLKFSPRF